MKEKLFLFTIIISVQFFSQSINYNEVANEISKLNRSGKYVESQKKISSLIAKNTDDSENARLLLLLAQTYRSINDSSTAIKYLKDAENHSQKASNKTRNDIQAEFAFAYFDNNQYAESEKIMTKIALGGFKNLHVMDKAYIIMQQGYVSFLKNNYLDAEIKYKASVDLIKKNSICDLPVINAKQIELLCKIGKLTDAEKLYHQSMSIADSCKILKYQLYLTDEFKKALIRLKNPKAIIYTDKLDSLNTKFDRDNKVSKMYLENLEKEKQNVESLQQNNSAKTIIYIITSFLLLMIISIFFKRNKKTNSEKQKIETELQRMKEELSSYIDLLHYSTQNNKNELNLDLLTERQIELISYLEKGLSNKEIAEKMFITEATVKYHIKNIYEILELKNRKEFLAKIKKSN